MSSLKSSTVQKHFLLIFLYGITFGHASISKIISFNIPNWFIEQFESTFLNFHSFALPASYIGIVLAEFIIFVIFILSFLVERKREELVFKGLVLSAVLFSVLSFGQRLTYQFDSSANLFFYACFSIILIMTLAKHENI